MLIRGKWLYELRHWCFSWNFPKISRTIVSKSNCMFIQWVLLKKRMGYLKSALSLAIHNVSKLKTFLLLPRCSIWSSDTKNIQNCIIVIFHLCLTKLSFEPTGYNVGSHILFHNRCKTITAFIPCFQERYRDVCVCVWEKKVSLMLKINSLQIMGSFSCHSKFELRKMKVVICIIAK